MRPAFGTKKLIQKTGLVKCAFTLVELIVVITILAVLSTPGLDPKDKTYFSYYLTRDKKYFQLMAFLEEEDNLQTAGLFNKTKAVDYSIKYPTVFGAKLGILTDELNVPVQEVAEIKTEGEIDLGGTNSGTVCSVHI